MKIYEFSSYGKFEMRDFQMMMNGIINATHSRREKNFLIN